MDTRPPQHIGVFLPDLSFGGVEQVMLRLSEGMVERGVTVDLVVADAEGPARAQVAPGVRLVDLGKARTVAALPGLVGYLRGTRPDVIIAAKDHAVLVAVLASVVARALAPRRPRVPVIATVHSLTSVALQESARRTGTVVARLLPWTLARCAAVVAVSDGVADDLRLLTAGKGTEPMVIRNPVITPELLAAGDQPVAHPWYSEPHAEPVLVWCGRLGSEKDPLTAVRAFALAAEHRPLRLVVVGDGPLRDDVEREANAQGVAERIALLGYQEQPAPFLAGADLFVLSSRREGMPTALVEAAALGTRVVATDCQAGPRELLGRNAPEALAPVGDSAALAAAMLQALDRPGPTLPPADLDDFRQDRATEHYLELCEQVGSPR